jgi:integrase/recombinase XerC/integrase/recombinase XerD
VERYKRYLTTRKRLSEVSVSTYLTSVRRFCGFLVQEGVLSGNPAAYVNGNSRPSGHSREILSVADVDRLLSVIDRSDERGKRDFAIIKLMVGCALSEIEVIRADVKDLESRQGQTVLAVQGKGRLSKDQRVVLGSDVRDAISEYLGTRNPVLPGSPLFASAGNRTRGARMTTRGVRDRVNAYLELAGIKRGRRRKVTPYSLRHTAAVIMADAGASAEEIRQRMRLGSEATAMLYIQQKQRTA